MIEDLITLTDEFFTNAKNTFKKINPNDIEYAVSLILKSNKIFVLGIGHSGFFGKIFAMKLNHVGLKAYTVFDEINPPFKKGDLFTAISQSGETSTIITLAEKAIKLGGKVFGITSNPSSTLTRLSEYSIILNKVDDKLNFRVLSTIGDHNNQNFLGSLFGLNIYLLFYFIIIEIAKRTGETAESINRRHANLQ